MPMKIYWTNIIGPMNCARDYSNNNYIATYSIQKDRRKIIY